MKWYQMKEQAAGEKRLMILWYIYNLLGKNVVCFVVYFVAFFAFCFSAEIRKYTKKNLAVIYEYTKNPEAKPTFINRYKNVLNYALSLVDKMETYARTFDIKKLDFAQETDKDELLDLMNNKKGIFFICSHIGNIEVLRTFISNPDNFVWPVNPHVNIFLSKNQCKVFNHFLDKISVKTNFSAYPVEDIDVSTAGEIQERLHKGDIVFLAGDRVSSGTSNVTFKADFLNKKVDFPGGTFKLAQLTEAPVYFISAIKAKNDTYKIYVQKFNPDNNMTKKQNLLKMQQDYTEFLQQMVKTAPLQFYHFYDLFE